MTLSETMNEINRKNKWTKETITTALEKQKQFNEILVVHNTSIDGETERIWGCCFHHYGTNKRHRAAYFNLNPKTGWMNSKDGKWDHCTPNPAGITDFNNYENDPVDDADHLAMLLERCNDANWKDRD